MRSHFLFLTLTILLIPLPGLAQSQRHPTNAEIESVLQDMHQEIPNLMQVGYYNDRRTPAERQQRDAFVEAWTETDRAIAPFLGNWSAIEENLIIVPSPTRGEVCIIDSYLEESDFYLGKVVDGNLYTDRNVTLVLDHGFLVSTFVSNGQAGHYEYANPRPVENPATSYYAEYHPDIVDQFQQAGCLISPPLP